MTSRLARSVFGDGGLLSRSHPGFEPRPGQILMSEAVAAAIASSRHLLMEAPTGTGKTFAYLVPAIESGRKVVVSTGTKNLQEQLFFKDLPQLERALDRPIPAAYMKGRDNYLCVKRFREFEAEPLFDEVSEVPLHGSLSRWSRTTGSGDRGELGELPDSLRLWERINARADTCGGQRCPDFESCFLTKMRRRAAEAQVVVVNHHLLLADLVLKEHAFGQVIPDYSVLIVDEAHALEEAATAHLGRSITSRQVSELADDIERAVDDPAVRRSAGTIRAAGRAFFGLMPAEGRFVLETYRRDAGWTAAGGALRDALSAAEATIRGTGAIDPESPGAALPARLLDQAAVMELILNPERSAHMVTWGEARGRSIALQASPIDVSEPLREMLFGKVPSVILTSATLAIDGSFDFVERRLGVDGATSLILETPFDLATQAVLYIPKDFPEPRHDSFLPRLVEQLRELLGVTSGRAFILFTSFANLRRVRDALAGTIPWPMMAQGDASRHALLERFRTTSNAVLLATSSFWHGVDVQGDALSLVVIDKLPFDVPSDPIVAARIEAIRKSGGVPFSEYQVPAAVIDLKQGLGRLIRSRRDRGVLAVMDARLMTRPYGRVFINSLPPYPVVHDLQDVRSFFASAN